MKQQRICRIVFSLFVAWPNAAQAEWLFLKWIEKPPRNGASGLIAPEDKVEFVQVFSFEKKYDAENWLAVRPKLQEGDVIAYRKGPWEARKEILLQGKLNTIGYRLLKYGHMAMVIQDPGDENSLRLLTSWSFRGPNTLEDLDALKDHSWDAYRLNQWEHVDKVRLYEFVHLVRLRAGKWYGYDFSGMFGLWNSNFKPNSPDDIARSYICSTVIIAALHYAGVELDVSPSYGVADVVTPLQLVTSKGRIVRRTAGVQGALAEQNGKEAGQEESPE